MAEGEASGVVVGAAVGKEKRAREGHCAGFGPAGWPFFVGDPESKREGRRIRKSVLCPWICPHQKKKKR